MAVSSAPDNYAMKRLRAMLAILLCIAPLGASAHRLDQYLEAAILSIGSKQVAVSLRLVPGVAVASGIIAAIDQNRDGAFSEDEQWAYARLVAHDLMLEVDRQQLPLRIVSVHFVSADQLLQGTGEIQIDLLADLPAGASDHALVFTNHFEQAKAAYLVNTLIPDDVRIHLGQQSRSQDQSIYQLHFVEETLASDQNQRSFSGFQGAFQLGLRHIAEGTDHLLFLLTLLLPAPLLARAGRWQECAGTRRSLIQMVRIVTAFTLGHSLTLMLSAFGLIHLPSRPVETLIAVSILVSACHAMRPIFPGKEAAIAAFFGLIHGAAFASALSQLGVNGWYRLVSVLGFNLGIETMQLAVVAALLPSLLMLAQHRGYRPFRIAGALFAGFAAVAWIVERGFDGPGTAGRLVERTAQFAPWLALLLIPVSLSLWWRAKGTGERSNPAANM